MPNENSLKFGLSIKIRWNRFKGAVHCKASAERFLHFTETNFQDFRHSLSDAITMLIMPQKSSAQEGISVLRVRNSTPLSWAVVARYRSAEVPAFRLTFDRTLNRMCSSSAPFLLAIRIVFWVFDKSAGAYG